MDEKKTQRLYTRVTSQEKRKIEQLAVKCGLSQSEYLRKRALGFVPKEVPPGAFFDFCGKLDELCNLCADKVTAETEERLLSLADDIHRTFLQTEKERVSAIKQSTRGGDN